MHLPYVLLPFRLFQPSFYRSVSPFSYIHNNTIDELFKRDKDDRSYIHIHTSLSVQWLNRIRRPE